MANISVNLSHGIVNGLPVTFKAPCDCTQIDGLKVYYPDGSQVFTFKDTHGNDLTGLGNLFVKGAYLKVILDVTNGLAYIQNADTNAYLEDQLGKKAPAGFGLGEGAKQYFPTSEAEFDTMLTECVSKLPDKSVGHFVFLDNTGNVWGGGTAHATVYKADYSYAFVEFNGYHQTCCNRFTKTLYGGNWGPIAWDNPPMQTGVEYLTTERWGGYSVYTKLISCGEVPASGRAVVAHNLNARIIRFAGSASNYNALPYRDPNSNGYGNGTVDVAVSGNNIIFVGNLISGVSPGNGHVQLWYVKG